MANNSQKQSALKSQNFKHLSRLPYYDQAKHYNDNYINLGYDYRGKLLQKTTSKELWSNPLQISLFGRIEGMLTMVLEQVKSIKKAFSFAHSRDTTNIN